MTTSDISIIGHHDLIFVFHLHFPYKCDLLGEYPLVHMRNCCGPGSAASASEDVQISHCV